MGGLANLTDGDEDEGFLAGLLHDSGNVVVLREASVQEGLSRERISMDAFEHLAHQYHQEMGELIAQEWQLPPDLRSLIADHHRAPAADDPLRNERCQLQLTDMLNAMLGSAPAVDYDLRASRPARELSLSDRIDFLQFLEDLPPDIAQVLSMV
jgi:HD-like signal output (HDOD) protein